MANYNSIFTGTQIDNAISTLLIASYELVDFHVAATTTGNGTSKEVKTFKNLTLSGIGTSTSRTFEVRGVDANGTDNALMGVRLKDFATATSFTVNAETWQFSIEGLVSVYVKITAIAGGNETIKGEITM
jgi:hypothetical protein